MQNTVSKPQIAAAFALTLAIAETIHELREVPAGPLYAGLMGKITLETFDKILGMLERQKLIRRTPGHLIQWIGPDLPKATAAKRGVE